MKKLNKRQRELKHNLLQTLKIERNKQKISQDELSYQTDISSVTICKMEKQNKSVNLDTFLLIADALGMELVLTKKETKKEQEINI